MVILRNNKKAEPVAPPEPRPKRIIKPKKKNDDEEPAPKHKLKVVPKEKAVIKAKAVQKAKAAPKAKVEAIPKAEVAAKAPEPDPVEDGVKDIKEAIVELAKPVKDADYSYYLSRLKKNRDWKKSHKAEVKAYNDKHLALPGIKEKYNKRRREVWAELKAKGPKRQRGRPRRDFITYNEDAINPMKVALGANTVNVAELLRTTLETTPKQLIPVPDSAPDKFKKILGKQVEISNNPDTWYFTRVGNWWIPNSHSADGGLSNVSKKEYLRRVRNFLSLDYTLPAKVLNPPADRKDDPNVISFWCLEEKTVNNPTPFDFWKSVNRLHTESLIHASRFNANTTPLATIWAATLRYWYNSSKFTFAASDFEKLGWMSQVWSSKNGLGAAAKNETFALRAKQEPSERVKDNIMEYDDFKYRALEFIDKYYVRHKEDYAIRPSTTVEQARMAAAVAAYIFIPPVRNSWAHMEFGVAPPTKGERRNVLTVNENIATAWWANFKNVKAFFAKNMTPLQQPLIKPLSSILLPYINLLKAKGVTKWLFPQQFTADSLPMTANDFGKFLGDTTQKFTEERADGSGAKRISSSILRIMFITWYHENSDSVFNQLEIKKIMVMLHQTDTDTHISYIKNILKSKGEESVEAIDARFDALMDMVTEEANFDNDGGNFEADDPESKITVPVVTEFVVKEKKTKAPAKPKAPRKKKAAAK